MPRARDKQQLLKFGKDEFSTLQDYVSKLSNDDLIKKEVFTKRTVKDIVAHLAAWHKLFLTWYKEGMKGAKPAIPAEGYSFKDTPKLNQKLYQEYKDLSWTKIWNQFEESHFKIMKIIEKHSDKDLKVKKKYAWTGSTNMASYMASATSSHYMWANDLLKKFNKKLITI